MPAFQLLLDAEKEGILTPETTLLVPSSGNTLVNIAYFKPAFHFKKVVGILEKNVSSGKKAQALLPGAGIEYPAKEGQSTIERAYELQEEGGGVVLDQYKRKGSVTGHRYTMNSIARDMKERKEPPSFLCAAAGTCSTLVAGEYLKENFPKLQVIGVGCSSEEEKVPGARPLSTIERDITFPWRKAVAPFDLVLCDKHSSFARSRDFIRQTRKPVGPSSGLAVEGFLRKFRELYENRELEQFANSNGKYVVVFVFMDAFPAYGPDYIKVLGENNW